MTEFEVLGTDREIDASDPVGSLMTMLYVVMGAAALFIALPVGRQIAGGVTGMIAQALGTNVGDADPGNSYGSPD